MCPPRPRRACDRWRACASAAMVAVVLTSGAPSWAGDGTPVAPAVTGRPKVLVVRLGGEWTDRLARPVLREELAAAPRTARLIFGATPREGALLDAGPRRASSFVLGLDLGVSYLRTLVSGDGGSWLSPFLAIAKSTLGLRLRF